MKSLIWTALFTLITVALASHGDAGAVEDRFPRTLSYQGRVENIEGGSPLQGEHNVRIRIYDAPTEGELVWEETHRINFTEGVFDVILGKQLTLERLSFDRSYWLTMLIEGDVELAPRTELTSSLYSLGTLTMSDGSVTRSKIASGAVVHSLNGLTDDVTLYGGSNITITPQGNDLWLEAVAGAADTDWTVSGDDLYSGPSGNVGIGDTTPTAKLTLRGGRYDLNQTDGDLLIGTSSYKLKFGVATSGLSAGKARIHAFGGYAELRLGRELKDVAVIKNEELQILDEDGNRTVSILGAANRSASPNPDIGGEIRLFRTNGTKTVEIDAEDMDDSESQGGKVALSNGTGVETVAIYGQEGISSNQGGAIYLRNDQGHTTVRIDGDSNERGRVVTDILQITGGADLSENFDVTNSALDPGTVLCIDPDHPGRLAISNVPYDRRVAGVVSGAGGVQTGMLMGQAGTIADGEHPVALSGRVYVRADASEGAIHPGDLLTTSSIAGHAMKATDPDRSTGAILGKAMTSLVEGRGLVLMLVTLQ